jgi:hypothetical protein
MYLPKYHCILSINCVAAKLVVVFLLFAQIAYALQPGSYGIMLKRGGPQNLEPLGDSPNSPVIIGPAADSHWIVVPHVAGYYIQTETGLHLAVQGTIHANAQIIIDSRPQVWNLERGFGPELFWISPEGHNQLVLDMSLLRIFPPRAALSNKRQDDLSQQWQFEPR